MKKTGQTILLKGNFISIQLGQRERNALNLATSVSGESISESVSRAEAVYSRFSRYKSQVLLEETQKVLRDVFGEDAVTSKSDSVIGLRMDQSQTDILLESWRSSLPDRLTAYKEHYESSFPLHEKSDFFFKIPSLDDIVEGFLIKRVSPKIVSEYDQQIPQSQTADNPMAPRGRAAQPSRDTRETN